MQELRRHPVPDHEITAMEVYDLYTTTPDASGYDCTIRCSCDYPCHGWGITEDGAQFAASLDHEQHVEREQQTPEA